MKSKKLIIAVLACAVLIAAGGIFWAMRPSRKDDTVNPAEANAQQENEETAASEAQQETPQVTETHAAVVTPEEIEPEAGIVFEDVDDTIFINADQVNLREEPSVDSESVAVVPLSCMIRRTGISEEWSRLSYEEMECYVANEYVVSELPETEETAETHETGGEIVVIDPGHQGQGDSTQEPIGPGASSTKARVTSGTTGSVSGWAEYQLNLEVSLQLRDELIARGYTVYMTRETHDVNISNMERAQFAAEHNGDILVRIHANGSTDSSVNGALCMAPSQSNSFLEAGLISESQRLSQCVIDSYVAATGFHNQGVYITDEMSGINWSTMPVTIVEMGYMSNPSDDALMADAQMQVKMVQGISKGIDAYFAQ